MGWFYFLGGVFLVGVGATNFDNVWLSLCLPVGLLVSILSVAFYAGNLKEVKQ